MNVPAPPADSAPGGKPPASGETPPPTKAPEKPKPPPAPPAPTFPAQAMYAGDATGSDLAIAVAVKGKQASAYLCDGAAVEDWLKGTADAGKMDLTSKNGESAINATLKGKRLAGTVTFEGHKLPFSIAIAPPPAGLYRGENGKTTVGWIVLPNGQQVGMVNNDGMESPGAGARRGRGCRDGGRHAGHGQEGRGRHHLGLSQRQREKRRRGEMRCVG